MKKLAKVLAVAAATGAVVCIALSIASAPGINLAGKLLLAALGLLIAAVISLIGSIEE